MRFQEQKPSAMWVINHRGQLHVVLLTMMLLFTFLVSGCSTDKIVNRTSEVVTSSPDSPPESNTPKELSSTDRPADPEGADENLSQFENQPSSKSMGQTIKGPTELKPLLAVMPGKSPRKKGGVPGPKVHLELAFDNADLYEVLDVTLYELYKVNYMVDPSIKATVTFHLSGDFTQAEFINILNNILQLNNLSIVKGPGEIFKIVRRETSAGSGNELPVFDAAPGQTGDITRMLRLRYIAAATAANNIKPFLSKNAVVVQDGVSNTLTITDTVDNIEKAASILGMMDVEYFEGISWRVFPITETDASEVAKDLSQVLKTSNLFNRPGVDQGSMEIVPIKTMNALLVVTRWPSMLKLVDDWINAMDHAGDSGANVFVYFVENGAASDLTDVLRQLYGGEAKGSSKRVSIVRPTDQKGPAGELSGNVEIIPDEVNNAIVFRASGRDYKIIKEILKELDIVPRQVLINVVIAEITLTGSLEYGVEWFLKDSAQSNYKVHGALDQGIERAFNTPLGTGANGLTVAVFDSDNLLRGLVSAVEKQSEVNILSSPNILAVDNKESKIEVGEQIPLPTGQSSTEGGVINTSIEYRDTGVLLTVTPHINSSGLVKLELSQEVSELGTEFKISNTLNANSILNRKAQTSLVIKDGQTIILAGLMRSKLDKGGSGIPFLRRIPILGYAFGGRSKALEKTELVFLITPRVIKSRAEADEITKEFSRRVEDVKELIRNSDH